MVVGLGVDIVQNDRIVGVIEKWGKKFLYKFFSDNEINALSTTKNKDQRLAANYAAKEAFVKAMGTGFRSGMKFKYIEINRDNLGKPYIDTHGKVKEAITKKGINNIHLTISHEKDYSVAVVIFED
ncbi:MAG: holo-ACP synthase [Thermodesulfobacteriota bacterium]